MNECIHIHALSGMGVAGDGSSVRMDLVDAAGRVLQLAFSVEIMSQLIMSLPRAAREQLRRRYSDDTLRIVYPGDRFGVELASDLRTLILTLQTTDGFEVSFGLSKEQCRQIGECADKAGATIGIRGRPS